MSFELFFFMAKVAGLVAIMRISRYSVYVFESQCMNPNLFNKIINRGPLDCRACVANMGQTRSGHRMSPIRRDRGAFDFVSLSLNAGT